MKILRFVFLVFLAVTFSAVVGVSTDFLAEKEALLVELNTARANPVKYGKSIGVDLSNFKPSKDLWFDIWLGYQAQEFAEILLKSKNLYHSGNANYRESILWNYNVNNSIKQFIIDANVLSLGHRKHLLDGDGKQTKVGIGIAKGRVGQWNRVYVVVLTQ